MNNMQNLVVVGLQWGDEGKGKIVDVLSENFDIVTRFQGGSNAGHTVKIGDSIFKFRLIPTGVVRGKKVVIGNGVVVDPIILIQEIEQLEGAGLNVDILVSDRAHMITPYQITIDGLEEKEKGKHMVGTTKRGIGPTYADKISRIGLRAADLIDIDTSIQWKLLVDTSVARINQLYQSSVDEPTKQALDTYPEILRRMAKYIGDTSEYLNDAIDAGKRVLFEGAQGSLLDIDHGTYPYVTSSNCVSAAAAIGTGVSPTKLDTILGIAKAYITRVGSGPFPTELDDKTGNLIRERGAEFGTVTGRPRRCGWLDLVALRYSTRLNGTQYLAITKADVLTNINPLKVCVAYEIDGQEITTVPANAIAFQRAKPIYEEMKGWKSPSPIQGGSDAFESLPSEMQEYLAMIEKWTSSKVGIVSLGPDRADTILIPDIFPEGSIYV